LSAGQAVDAPLAGIRVLDLTRLLPGPVCTQYLSDLGADVIKVEDTRAGDYARTLGKSVADRSSAASTFYRAVNRNKRSLAIDLKDARGREAFLLLADAADVIVEGFRPGVVAGLGIDYAVVAARNPGIVYCSLSGYGQTGPRAGMAGHDINYLGYAGVLDQTGVRGGPPALSNLQIADLLGGAASAAIAILASLLGAQRQGRGRYIDVSMADASLAHGIFALNALEQHGHTLARGCDLLTGGVPCYGVYATQDGRFVAVGALEEKFWRALCATIERDDLVPQQFARGEAGDAARRELQSVFGAAPLAHWVSLLAQVDCCVTPVLTLDEALADPQFAARAMIATRSDGTHAFAPPFVVSNVHPAVAGEAPGQGADSTTVLREAGLGADAIAALLAAGVVRTFAPA
jgi:crotonobetainyl-CoA:carnitine CoA-transferase CaiB-like acyl-CoA transferase